MTRVNAGGSFSSFGSLQQEMDFVTFLWYTLKICVQNRRTFREVIEVMGGEVTGVEKL